MSDLMMNTHTCVSHSINYSMSYVRSICLIQWWMYTHALIIAILAPCCLSDQYVSINNVCTHMFYWKYYLHHFVGQTSMSDLMMHIHTRGTANTAYTMLYVRSICLIKWWISTHVLMIALLAPCCLSDQYVWFSDECIPKSCW
jgi:hypothetical protein